MGADLKALISHTHYLLQIGIERHSIRPLRRPQRGQTSIADSAQDEEAKRYFCSGDDDETMVFVVRLALVQKKKVVSAAPMGES